MSSSQCYEGACCVLLWRKRDVFEFSSTYVDPDARRASMLVCFPTTSTPTGTV